MEVLRSIWLFVQDQVLGMKWLNEVIGNGFSVVGLDSYIQSYFPPERNKKILGRFHGIWANIIAALLGTVTPSCSCSSVCICSGLRFNKMYQVMR